MTEKQRRFSNRNTLFTLLRFIIAGGLIIYLVYYLDYEKIIDSLTFADYRIVLLVFLMSFLNLFLQYKKWQLVAGKQLGIQNKRDVIHSLFFGISAGAFTPMKIGEYAGRAIPFKNHGVVEVSIATLIDKIVPLLIILIIGAILLPVYLVSQNILSALGLLFMLSVIIFIAGLILFLKSKTGEWLRRIIDRLSKVKLIKKTIDQFGVIGLVRGRYLYKLIFLSFLFHLTFTTQFSLLLVAFSHQWNFLLYLYMANLVIFIQVIIPPVAFGELGIREGAAVYFAENLGMIASIGFNAALLLFVINFILPSVYGLYFLIRRKK